MFVELEVRLVEDKEELGVLLEVADTRGLSFFCNSSSEKTIN